MQFSAFKIQIKCFLHLSAGMKGCCTWPMNKVMSILPMYIWARKWPFRRKFVIRKSKRFKFILMVSIEHYSASQNAACFLIELKWAKRLRTLKDTPTILLRLLLWIQNGSRRKLMKLLGISRNSSHALLGWIILLDFGIQRKWRSLMSSRLLPRASSAAWPSLPTAAW